MEVDGLVTLRPGEFDNRRELLLGLLFAIGRRCKQKTYYVHAHDETRCVADNDLGPAGITFDVFEPRRKRGKNERWQFGKAQLLVPSAG